MNEAAASGRRRDPTGGGDGPVVEATGIGVAFEGQPVLGGLSLAVEPGEVVAVIGPSGVGKTTLLRVLALAVEPDDGTISVGGVDAWAAGEAERLALRRRVGMVFQEASLFEASVARNVEYGLRVRRSWRDRLDDAVRAVAGRSEPPEMVREALAVVGMDGRADQPARSLSGGEAQRVSFARALAYGPGVLLLDEPTSDLDPRNTGVIERALREAGERGIGVVVATHDMHQAERVADRVAVLLDDGLVEVGPTAAIFEDPTDERTRKFISGELVY